MDIEKFGMKLKSRSRAALVAVLTVASPVHWSAPAEAATVTSLDFKTVGSESQIEIRSDGPVSFEKQENSQDRQIILELKGAKLNDTTRRKLDTSSFNSSVTLVSPYQVEGQPDTARVVIQLRDSATADVKQQDGNLIRVSIPNPSPASAEPGMSSPTLESQSSLASNADTGSLERLPPPEAKERLEKFMESRENKHFTGKPITIQVRGADVTDVLRLIGEASGFNIVVSNEVRGKITLSLADVPWDQALDVVLHTMRLGAERNHNLLRVVTLSELTTEKQEELRAKQAAQANAPRITRVFPISYADPNELQQVLSKFGSATASANQAGGGGSGGATGPVSVVHVDRRTNSIVVQDVPENIEKMKKLVEILDTQTPQVLIEAKVIEAQENFSREIGGSLGFGDPNSNQYFASFNGANPLDALIGSVFTGSTAGAANAGNFGLSPSMAFLPGVQRLNAVLKIGETDNLIKVISSPRTVVLNKDTANIVQSTPVLLPPSAVTVPGGTTTISTEVRQANLSLNVQPTVTNEGSVLLQLNITRDVPVAFTTGSGIANRNITTKVLVDDGSTLVIGGIYSSTTNNASGGIPLLRKIPIIGSLFGSEKESTQKTELFIFITPKILNTKEAGISS